MKKYHEIKSLVNNYGNVENSVYGKTMDNIERFIALFYTGGLLTMFVTSVFLSAITENKICLIMFGASIAGTIALILWATVFQNIAVLYRLKNKILRALIGFFSPKKKQIVEEKRIEIKYEIVTNMDIIREMEMNHEWSETTEGIREILATI